MEKEKEGLRDGEGKGGGEKWRRGRRGREMEKEKEGERESGRRIADYSRLLTFSQVVSQSADFVCRGESNNPNCTISLCVIGHAILSVSLLFFLYLCLEISSCPAWMP